MFWGFQMLVIADEKVLNMEVFYHLARLKSVRAAFEDGIVFSEVHCLALPYHYLMCRLTPA